MEFRYDAFLSHNIADKPCVRELAQKLKMAGLRVWFDDWIIQPGDDIYLTVERGLEVSRNLILCLSPAALGSDWVKMERSTVLFRDPANVGRRLIPLLLVECDLPDSLRRYKYLDYRKDREVSFAKLLAALRLKTLGQTEPSSFADDASDAGCGPLQEDEALEFRQGLAEYIYGQPQRAGSVEIGIQRRLLIVDDDSSVREMLEMIVQKHFQNVEVVTAADGASALEIMKRGAFDVVVTDIVLPGIFGWELAQRILQSNPETRVIAMSGYFTETSKVQGFYENGGFRYHPKPFSLETLVVTLEMAFEGRIPCLLQKLSQICYDPGPLLHNIQDLSDSVHFILMHARKEGHIAHTLLRHKLKHTIADLLKCVGTERNFAKRVQAVNSQAKSLCRLAWATAKASESAFPTFLRQYVTDLQKEHQGVKILLRVETAAVGIVNGSGVETILALVICELLDNAISAVGTEGFISVNISHLRSTSQISIVVQDNGQGIASADQSSLFTEGFSTKGAGRGLGLHLIQEAVHQFRGKITYKTLDGACFSVVIPLTSATNP